MQVKYDDILQKIKFYTRAKFQNLHTILGASIIAVSSHPIRVLISSVLFDNMVTLSQEKAKVLFSTILLSPQLDFTNNTATT